MAQAREALPALWAGWTVAREEDAVWEALARGLSGPALTDAYVRTWQARALMAEEGTAVTPLGHDVEREVRRSPEAGGCEVELTWTWRVALAHQGHRHLRILRDRAWVRLEEGRIVELVPLDASQVEGRVVDPWMDEAAVDPGFVPAEEWLEAGLMDEVDR